MGETKILSHVFAGLNRNSPFGAADPTTARTAIVNNWGKESIAFDDTRNSGKSCSLTHLLWMCPPFKHFESLGL
jgi:hypothetical protein